MIRESDLEQAVLENVISAEQAAKLRALAETRIRKPHETNERFVVVNNLAELFVSIGQVLFFAALLIAGGSIGAGFGVVAGWAMAEFFARHRNMRWPAVVASIAAALCAAWLVFVATGGFDRDEWQTKLLLPYLAALISIGLSIWRYRLPFLALPFACSLAGLAGALLPWPRELSLVTAGAIALLLAVVLDLSDRDRMTRKSAFAFWLYVAGAPLFLHPIYSSVTSPGQSLVAIALVLGIAATSCLFGLLLDRRSPIVASLIYLGIIIVWSARALAISPSLQTALALFILGSGVMLLGIWWKQARAALLSILPVAFVNRLPLTEIRA